MKQAVKTIYKRLEQLILSKQRYQFVIKQYTALPDLNAVLDTLACQRYSRLLMPLETPHPIAKRILVIAPHHDDEMLGAGGTLIKAIDAGSTVDIVYLTSGKPAQQAQLEAETQSIAQHIGYRCHFLRLPLQAIPVSVDVIKNLQGLIKEIKPNALFLPAIFDDHDDHRRANELLLATLNNKLEYASVDIWAYQVYSALIPNVVVKITEQMDEKENAIRIWKVQNQSRDWAHYIRGLNAANVRFLQSTEPDYAETFFKLPLMEYLQLCQQYFNTSQVLYFSDYYKDERKCNVA